MSVQPVNPAKCIHRLSHDPLGHVFSFLPTCDLLTVQMVQKKWHGILLQQDVFWRHAHNPITPFPTVMHATPTAASTTAPAIHQALAKRELGIQINLKRFSRFNTSQKERMRRSINTCVMIRGQFHEDHFCGVSTQPNSEAHFVTVHDLNTNQIRTLACPGLKFESLRKISRDRLLLGSYSLHLPNWRTTVPPQEATLTAVVLETVKLNQLWQRKLKMGDRATITHILTEGNHLFLCTKIIEINVGSFRRDSTHLVNSDIKLRRYALDKIKDADQAEYLPAEEEVLNLPNEVTDIKIYQGFIYIAHGMKITMAPLAELSKAKDFVTLVLTDRQTIQIMEIHQDHLFVCVTPPPEDRLKKRVYSEIYIFNLKDRTLRKKEIILGYIKAIHINHDFLFVDSVTTNSCFAKVVLWKMPSRTVIFIDQFKAEPFGIFGLKFKKGLLYRLTSTTDEDGGQQIHVFDFNPQFQRPAALVHDLSVLERAYQTGTEQLAMQRFAALPEAERNKIYERVWNLKGSPQGIPQFGELSFHASASLPKDHCTPADKLAVIQRHKRIAERTVIDIWSKTDTSTDDKKMEKPGVKK